MLLILQKYLIPPGLAIWLAILKCPFKSISFVKYLYMYYLFRLSCPFSSKGNTLSPQLEVMSILSSAPPYSSSCKQPP